jgi:hypothetical protein
MELTECVLVCVDVTSGSVFFRRRKNILTLNLLINSGI